MSLFPTFSALASLWATLQTSQPVSPSAGRAPDSLMVPGVSRALADHRARTIGDVRYDLALDLTASDAAVGRITTRFTVARTRNVIFDFRGRRLTSLRVNGTLVAQPEFTGAHLRLPPNLIRRGQNRVDISFVAPIAPSGAAIIQVKDRADSADYLYTLLVPADANLLFPSFDQPDVKARVTLTLTTRHGWTAVANGERLHVDTTSRGVVHAFRETEPISTYLVAFAAGPWVEKRIAGTSRPISLYVRRSRAAEVEADSIIQANDRAIGWLAKYFGHPYPFQKFDIVLAPAFPFGGMEHPGAIFYNEERFIYRERPTLTQRLGRTSTIYHEVAHQWFGDFVTMKWFDDLWLKEGFATYMATKMQDALDSTSQAWKGFYLRTKPPAYAVDGSEGTQPIWQELANLDQAKSNYGPIVYNKAPAVLKQLNYLVGEDAFRNGVRRFLAAHRYGNATWRDLLDAIGEAAESPLSDWGAQWFLRAGMPILEPRIDVRDGRIARLTIAQRPARAAFGAAPWPTRLQLVLAYDSGRVLQRIPVTVDRETTLVADAIDRAEPSWVFANGGDQAYGIVLLDPHSLAALERTIGTVREPLMRAMLWGAMWDHVREAMMAPERYAALVSRELPREQDEQIVNALIGRLTRVATSYLAGVTRSAYLPDVERALLRGASDGSRSYSIRKAHVDAFIRVASTPPAVATLRSFLDSTSIAGEPLRAPTRWTIVTRLVAMGAPGSDSLLAAEASRDATDDGLRRAFVARAARADATTKGDYFRRFFADSTLNEEWVTSSLDAFNAPESMALAKPYLRAALDSLPWVQQHRRIFFLGSWISAFLDGQTDADALAVVRDVLASGRLAPDLKAKVLQAMDELERTVRIRRTFSGVAALPGSPGTVVPKR